VTLDTDQFVRWDADLRSQRREGGGDFRALGGWHSHPVGAATPSAADLDCWAHRLSTMIDPGSSLTTLIAARRDPDRDSWRNPRITAWITRHARSSFGERMVCEPGDGERPVRLRRRSDTVLCTRSLLLRGPHGYARVIQEGEHVRRGDPIIRSHRAYFGRRRWWPR
jgi:hypothetical protein